MNPLLVSLATLILFGPVIFVLGAVVGIYRTGRFSKGLLTPLVPKRISGIFPLVRRDDLEKNGGAS